MFKLGSLVLLCLLVGCAGAAPRASSACIPGNPGGSYECQAETYRLSY